jgi:hypothetical protein
MNFCSVNLISTCLYRDGAWLKLQEKRDVEKGPFNMVEVFVAGE